MNDGANRKGSGSRLSQDQHIGKNHRLGIGNGNSRLGSDTLVHRSLIRPAQINQTAATGTLVPAIFARGLCRHEIPSPVRSRKEVFAMSMRSQLQSHRMTSSLSGIKPSHTWRPELGLALAFVLVLFVPFIAQAQTVKSVTAGDSSIQIGGTRKNPTVAVAPDGITNAKVGNGALSPAKITGTAATLGSNDFTGTQTIAIDGGGGDSRLLNVTQTGSVGGTAVVVSTSTIAGEGILTQCTGNPNDDCEGIIAIGFSEGVDARGNTAVRANGNLTGVQASSATGTGVAARSGTGTAGSFDTTSGNILLGTSTGTNKFRVDAAGNVFATSYNIGGADFAESVEPAGRKDAYHSGDVVVIDQAAQRRVDLAREPYSTLVAGIYSTKPGVLASRYSMDDPRLAKEIPLAVVGIVPCNASAENGPIKAGDLLVTSATPGYAMKGTDRSRMLGAVLGKALEPLPKGKGVIQVLITLQ
jgi:hypothetical protein